VRKLACGLVLSALLLTPLAVFGQNSTFYNLVKSRGSETFTFSSDVANRNNQSPAVYTYDQPKGPDWILQITNNLTYTAENNSKVILRLQEPVPSQKFIEVAMYGGPAKKFWVAVNTTDTSYQIVYSSPSNSGWSSDQPVLVTQVENQGLSITDGKRTVVDRLDIQGFTVGSIEAYGVDGNSTKSVNVNGGSITLQMLSGSAADSPVYYVPLGIMLGVGGLMGGLLYFKKRKPND
jgi:hypothetical protein